MTKNIFHNKVVRQNASFSIEVVVQANALQNEEIRLQLLKGGKVLQEKEILIETENQLQYSVCGYFENLRTSFGDSGSQVSNIIGWAYDGNPIYGPYGYSDPENFNSVPNLFIVSLQS